PSFFTPYLKEDSDFFSRPCAGNVRLESLQSISNVNRLFVAEFAQPPFGGRFFERFNATLSDGVHQSFYGRLRCALLDRAKFGRPPLDRDAFVEKRAHPHESGILRPLPRPLIRPLT